MHTYNATSRGTFEVGIFRINGSWSVIKELETEIQAISFVNVLNGGIPVIEPDFLNTIQNLTTKPAKKLAEKKPVQTKDKNDGQENQ
jgi:hypothetical protein